MDENKSQPLIIGHRGAYDEAPENTLKGFKKAIELGLIISNLMYTNLKMEPL